MSGLFYRPIMPSSQSFSGQMIDVMDAHAIRNMDLEPDPDMIEDSLGKRVTDAARRVFCAVVLAISATVDLVWWLGMTITIYPMHQTGYQNHLINLISTVALYAFFLPVCFGYFPHVDHHRFFCKTGDAALKEIPPRNPWFSKANLNYVKERLALNPVEAVPEFAQETDAESARIAREGFGINFHQVSCYHLSRGLNLNATRDLQGRTWVIRAAAQSDLLTTWQTVNQIFLINHAQHPGLRQNIDLNIQDADGFDALTYALTGVSITTLNYDPPMPGIPDLNRPMYSVRTTRFSDSDKTPVIPLLLRKGAILQESRFEEYRDFVQTANTQLTTDMNNPAGLATAMQQLQQSNQNHRNRYIRMVAALFLPQFTQGHQANGNDQRRFVTLLQNAEKLVSWKPEILALWHVQYEKRVKQEKELVSAGFREHKQDPFFTNETTGDGAKLIAEYLVPVTRHEMQHDHSG